MFSRIGKKLMTYAGINTAAGLVLGLILIIISLQDAQYYGVNWILFVSGLAVAFVGYIASLSIYALGQITEDVHSIAMEKNGNETDSDGLSSNIDELPEL